MTNNILDNKEFLLGIQENWDSYYEATVQFVNESIIKGFNYYVFTDKRTGSLYYLLPRYKGQFIEGIFARKRIIVNIAKQGPNIDQPLVFFATGILQLPNPNQL